MFAPPRCTHWTATPGPQVDFQHADCVPSATRLSRAHPLCVRRWDAHPWQQRLGHMQSILPALLTACFCWTSATATNICVHSRSTGSLELPVQETAFQNRGSHPLPSRAPCAAGGYEHICKVWDVRARSATMSLDHGAPIEALAYFPSGQLHAHLRPHSSLHIAEWWSALSTIVWLPRALHS